MHKLADNFIFRKVKRLRRTESEGPTTTRVESETARFRTPWSPWSCRKAMADLLGSKLPPSKSDLQADVPSSERKTEESYEKGQFTLNDKNMNGGLHPIPK